MLGGEIGVIAVGKFNSLALDINCDSLSSTACIEYPILPQVPEFPLEFGTGNSGTVNAVTYVATDPDGNVQNCTTRVTVVDLEDPEFECPADVIVETSGTLAAGTGHTAVGFNISSYTPNVTDNSGYVVSILPSGYPEQFTLQANGSNVTYYITWTAIDPSLNTLTCVQRITVIDVTPPTITCPVRPSQFAE